MNKNKKTEIVKKMIFFQKKYFFQKNGFDKFYGNARVIRIENHYAYGNGKTQMFSSYYQALHDIITKRFFHKNRHDYHKTFLHGEKWLLRKNFGLRNIFKKWVAYAKMKMRNKIIF